MASGVNVMATTLPGPVGHCVAAECAPKDPNPAVVVLRRWARDSSSRGRQPMWAIRGRIVPLASDTTVAPTEDAVFTGRVWIDETTGRIIAVTRGRNAGPPGSSGAPVADVGSSLVIPGLVDLHNHLAYNTLPLWTEPEQQVPFLHHNSWTRADSYAASTTWPAYGLITTCPHELLGYVETKAIVGATTSIQGSPPHNRPRDGWLVRNIED